MPGRIEENVVWFYVAVDVVVGVEVVDCFGEVVEDVFACLWGKRSGDERGEVVRVVACYEVVVVFVGEVFDCCYEVGIGERVQEG